jgi:hypothetical protein
MNKTVIKLELLLLVAMLLLSCESQPEERPASWYGKWETTWKTLPSSDEGFDVFTDFETDGSIVFNENDVTVTINGFPGCIFGPDTLSHTQQWKVKGDSMLQFYTAPDTIGIAYTILSTDESKIELRLLEDIFLTLNKSE